MHHILKGNKEDQETLDQLLNEFNFKFIPCNQNPYWEEMCFVIKDTLGHIIGGVHGHLVRKNILSIFTLFVREQERSQKYGSHLLQKIEEEAKSQGAYLSRLDTFDFQALDFYLKHGYKVFGICEDNPTPGHKRYYLSKRL